MTSWRRGGVSRVGKISPICLHYQPHHPRPAEQGRGGELHRLNFRGRAWWGGEGRGRASSVRPCRLRGAPQPPRPSLRSFGPPLELPTAAEATPRAGPGPPRWKPADPERPNAAGTPPEVRTPRIGEAPLPLPRSPKRGLAAPHGPWSPAHLAGRQGIRDSPSNLGVPFTLCPP